MGAWEFKILLSTFVCLRLSIIKQLRGEKTMQPHRVCDDGKFQEKMSNQKLKLMCVRGQGEG